MARPPATPVRLSPSNVDTEEGSSSRSNSPDGNCPICLGNVNNKAFTDACFHTFCFVCLLEWSKIRPTCPLCKTTFKSIIHNVVSNDIYDQYHLKPADTSAFGTDGRGRRFRYSTTLTEEHRFELMWRRNRALERRHNRAHQIHQQATSEEWRRMIYRAGLRVRHMGSNQFTRFRDISPEFFCSNPATTHRLVPWLRRELGILFSGEDHVTFMTQYILSLLPNVHIQTEEFHEHMRPFLYSQTEHFIHEFVSFARSPYDMNTYDQIAQYDFTAAHRPQREEHQPLPPLQSNTDYSDVISLSSDDDVIEVPTLRSLLRSDSASSNSSQVANEQVEALDLSSTHNPEPPRSHQSDPDRPGPSGISSNQPAEVKPEYRSDQENIIDDNSDIEIVGVVKPYDERTPECVILSSSTEEDEDRSQSRRADKQGGKRHQKRKHTQESDDMERYEETSQHLSKSSEHHHREKMHRHSHKKEKYRHRKHSNDTTTHSKCEHSRTHSQHSLKQEHTCTSHKHHKRSRSRSLSKSSSSSYNTWRSSFKDGTSYPDNYGKKASSRSTHFDGSHSRDTSRQQTEYVHHKDSHRYGRRHGTDAGSASYEGQQRVQTSEADSWKLQWHNKDIASDSANRYGHSRSSGEGMATVFKQHSHDHHYKATLSKKQRSGDSFDDRERSKIRRHSEDLHSSSLHLTMVFSRTKTRTPERREKSSSGTDVVSLKSSHSHHRKQKKHKRHKTESKHKRHKAGCSKEKPNRFEPYTYYSVYGNEEEANDGDESFGSTEEEDETFT